jgi:hypothetical protein
MVLLYMVTWIPSIYPLYVTINIPAPWILWVTPRITKDRALFPEPVKCTGALGAGAAEAKARTEKMPWTLGAEVPEGAARHLICLSELIVS